MLTSTTGKGLRSWLPISYVILCTILSGIIAYFYIYINDDLGYCRYYKEYIFQGADFPGFGRFFDFFVEAIRDVNGRLGDKFIILYVAIPPLINALICILCFLGIFIYYNHIMDEFVKTKDGKVYYDDIGNDVSVLCLRKVQRDAFTTGQSTYLIHPQRQYLKLLPTEFKHLDMTKMRLINDTAQIYLTPQGNMLQRLPGVKDFEYGALYYVDKNGETKILSVTLCNMRIPGDSTLVYTRPHFHTWQSPEDMVMPIETKVDY